MTVRFNHTIIQAHDKAASAEFLGEILGLPPYRPMAHFAVLSVGKVSLDFIETSEPIAPRHFAFLVSEPEFDEILGRLQTRGLPIWADPFRRQLGEINHWDDGRGVYFEDPNGHLLEVLTRAYGSGGLDAEHPNPL